MYDIIFPFWPNIDITAQIHDSFPVLSGQTKETDSMKIGPGGMTTTLAVAANLGLSIIPYGKIGMDEPGNMLIRSYKKLGIPTEFLIREEKYETRKVFVIIDRNRCDHVFISMNNGEFGPVDRAVDLLKICRGVSLSGYYCASSATKEDTQKFMNAVRKTDLPVFFDPGPMFTRLPDNEQDEVLSRCNYIIANEEEGLQLGKASTVAQALENISKRTYGHVIIKTGKDGCAVRCPDGSVITVPGLSAEVVDTTGAGDSFIGAFMYGIMKKMTIEQTCLLANATGAVMVEKLGSGDIAPTREEIEAKLYRNGYDPSSFFPQ